MTGTAGVAAAIACAGALIATLFLPARARSSAAAGRLDVAAEPVAA